MKTAKFLTLLFAALLCTASKAHADTFGSGANAFDIEFVTIGDPGNAADTTGEPNPAGSVPYVFRIGKFEVSRDMVQKANTEGGLGIHLIAMAFIDGGPRPNMPATGMTWNEAARFVNWLNTSRGFPEAYKFSMQPGDPGYEPNVNIELWQDGDPGFDAANPFRNSQAEYFLPSADEWYKAAYHDPAANGGAGDYWDFPAGSDAAPTAVPSGTDSNTSVYSQPFERGPADITEAGGPGPYSAIGLGGNVWEWEETEFDLVNDDSSSFRGFRGGEWNSDAGGMHARHRHGSFPSNRIANAGFRIASIPEPSTVLLGALGAMGLLMWRKSSGS